jgi:PEGA domain
MKKMFIVVLSSLLFTNCATILSGSKKLIKFNSTPNAATILINEIEVGKTPFETKLKANKDYNVKIILEGYKPFEIKLKQKINHWIWGNILIGGLVGYIVDLSTGAIYRLSPKEINCELSKNVAYNNKGVSIYATLDINPSWEKVGQLEKY